MGDTTESAAIVRAVTGLGEGIQIPVIAEGVATVEPMLCCAASMQRAPGGAT
jgi:EAL domain-containing protein (putative c-di-GMP-specific phosphodiesterase class I)